MCMARGERRLAKAEDGPDLVHDGVEAERPDLPGLARGLVEAGGQPDPVAQCVADGVESLGDRRRQAELARVDDAADHDELERAGTGGAGRFGEQRVVARGRHGPPLAPWGQGRVHQLVSSRGESQDVCGTCLEAGVSRFIWVGRIVRFGPPPHAGFIPRSTRVLYALFSPHPPAMASWSCACFEAGQSWEAPAARGRGRVRAVGGTGAIGAPRAPRRCRGVRGVGRAAARGVDSMSPRPRHAQREAVNQAFTPRHHRRVRPSATRRWRRRARAPSCALSRQGRRWPRGRPLGAPWRERSLRAQPRRVCSRLRRRGTRSARPGAECWRRRSRCSR